MAVSQIIRNTDTTDYYYCLMHTFKGTTTRATGQPYMDD